MAKITRKNQKIFAGSYIGLPAGILAQFGSQTAGSPNYSDDPDVIQALAAFTSGLQAALVVTGGGAAAPEMQDINSLFYLAFRQLAYLFQAGMPEWDAGTEYDTNSFCQVAGVVYVSKQDNNTGHAVTDTNWWKTYASMILGTAATAALLKAWVVFDGRTGAIDSSMNVSSVTRTGPGVYLVNFTAPMTDALYGFAGSASTRPSAGFLNGDDNIITGGAPGKPVTRTTAYCTVFCYDRPNSACEDAGIVAVNFFGN